MLNESRMAALKDLVAEGSGILPRCINYCFESSALSLSLSLPLPPSLSLSLPSSLSLSLSHPHTTKLLTLYIHYYSHVSSPPNCLATYEDELLFDPLILCVMYHTTLELCTASLHTYLKPLTSYYTNTTFLPRYSILR